MRMKMTKATTAPTYTLASNETRVNKSKKNKHKRVVPHGKVSTIEDPDPTDGAGSLTYSATSSVQSGGSAAGESTDSSFADIMRVLDVQDSKELAALIKKEGVSSAVELREKRGIATSGVSVASSLNYSTDGESALEGSKLLQTIAGQPSDSYAFDGGGASKHHEEQPIKGDNNDILFAPAAPADNIKRQKDKKRREKQHQEKTNPPTNNNTTTTTPKAKNSTTSSLSDDARSSLSPKSSMHKVSVSRNSPSSASKPGTPPPVPPKGIMEEDDEDIFYAKWWMTCFSDAFTNLMPKR